MKRIITLLMAFLILFNFLPGCAENSPSGSDGRDIPDSWKEELRQSDSIGISIDSAGQDHVTGSEMMALLDRLVASAAPEKLGEWQAMYSRLREHSGALTRFDAMGMLYLAGIFIGGDYDFLSRGAAPEVISILHFPWDAYYFTPGLFDGIDGPKFSVPGFGDNCYLDYASLHYNLWYASPVSGEYPFAYDADANSIHEDVPPTCLEAALAVARVFCIASIPDRIPLDDPAALTPGTAISKELMEKAGRESTVTGENHPLWHGIGLGYGYEYQFGTSAEEFRHAAEWGFNSIHLYLHYLTLFDADARTASSEALAVLDGLVAAAIEYDLHLNLCLTGVPGRSVMNLVDDYNYTGDFDLFINPQKQEKTLNIYRMLAARYRDISSDYLSFMPTWEAMNKNLSTGLPYEDYTADDVASFLGKAIDTIRAEDPDRLIIYEPTANNDADQIILESTPVKKVADSRGNVLISYNFCETAYNYACMTATEGKHIDNMNHSMFIPDYPNYIYSVSRNVHDDVPLTLNGFLPAGTTVDVYLARSGGAVMDILVDGKSVYREELPQNTEYQVGETLSFYYPFAVSDRKISIVLENDANEIIISNAQRGGYDLSGICLTYPEEFAVERWYYIQSYDVFQGNEEKEGVVKRRNAEVLISPNDDDGGRSVTIHEDLTYSSEKVLNEASPETIERWCSKIAAFDSNCIIRYERADFSGVKWNSMAAYYNDLLSAFNKHGFSWWSNDWWLMTDEYGQKYHIAEGESVEYDGYPAFNLDLLRLLQKYQ